MSESTQLQLFRKHLLRPSQVLSFEKYLLRTGPPLSLAQKLAIAAYNDSGSTAQVKYHFGQTASRQDILKSKVDINRENKNEVAIILHRLRQGKQ